MPTNYDANSDQGKAGLIANVSYPYQAVGGLVNAAPVAFGRLVKHVPGTEKGVAHFDHPAHQPEGVSVIDTGITEEAMALAGLENCYPANYPVTVLKDGEIWVQIEEDVTPDSDVYVRTSTTLQVSTLTFDIDFVTSNSTVATVNGTALAANVFDTNHNTTIAALAVLIQAHADVLTATVTAGRVITITSVNATPVVVTTVTTLGASQPVSTQAQTVAGDATDAGIFRATSVTNQSVNVPSTIVRYAGTYSAANGLAVIRRKTV